MFLKVKMDDKTLVINLGSDLSKASDLVEMFEKNAKVVHESYSDVKLVNVQSTVALGSEIKFEASGYSSEVNIVLSAESDVTGLVNADVNAFIDVKSINAKHEATVKKLNVEIASLRASLNLAEQRIEELNLE